MAARRLIWVVACLFIFSKKIFPQDYPFIKYTPKDGLVSNRVQNFYQDTRGRIFFMTPNGLSVYDGTRFLNYGIGDGLPSPLVNDVLELAADSFFIATNAPVLNVLVGGSIKTLQTKNGFCPVINKFYRDKDQVIYVGSDQGLYRFDKDIFTPVVFDDKEGNRLKAVYDILELGNYLLVKRPHVFPQVFDLVFIHKVSLQSHPFQIKGPVSCVLPVKQDQLLLVIVNGKILSFDLHAAEQGILKPVTLPGRYRFLEQLHPVKVVIDRFQVIWCVTNNSVVRFRSDGRLQTYNKKNGLDVTSIHSIVVDKENVLWVLTDGNGVWKLVNRNLELQPGDMRAVYEDSLGRTWMLGSSGRTLSCIFKDQVKQWKLNPASGFVDLGMRKNTLVLYDYYSVYETVPLWATSQLYPKKIYSDADPINSSKAEISEDDHIYLPGKFLTIINPGNDVIRVRLPAIVDQVSLDNVQQLWAVTRTSDLLCYKINPGSPSHLSLTFSDKVAVSDPRSMVVDKAGNVWIGTRISGIYCLEYRDKKLVSQKHWLTADGLSDNFIYYLSCDHKNVIWAGTQGGLDMISCSGTIVESITRKNNIYQMIFKIVVGKDNTVWGIGTGGILRVTNDTAVTSAYQPQIQITRIRNGNTDLDPSGETALLSSRARELIVDVAAPSFIDEKGIRFSYLLDGEGKGEWSPPTADASFRFINLPPAKYMLRVRAFFPVAHYKPQELMYRFTILPQWWQTWWFRLLGFLVFLMAVILVIKAYYKSKLQKQRIIFEKQQAIQQERSRIAMEMHDDLGSGLTVIRYLAGGLESTPPRLLKEKALKIETSAKELVDSMNDIIWTIKSDNNHLSDILGYIRKMAAEMLENVGIDYMFDFPEYPEDIVLTNELKRNLLLLSKEIVHNVIKHARATRVTITARQNHRSLQLCFSDNGNGMGHQKNPFGNGLKNMQQRVQQFGGNMEIGTGDGTTVKVAVKLA